MIIYGYKGKDETYLEVILRTIKFSNSEENMLNGDFTDIILNKKGYKPKSSYPFNSTFQNTIIITYE